MDGTKAVKPDESVRDDTERDDAKREGAEPLDDAALEGVSGGTGGSQYDRWQIHGWRDDSSYGE